MKIQEIKVKQYIFDLNEIDTVIKALLYARHRITKHPTCGASVMSLAEIEKILRDFNK